MAVTPAQPEASNQLGSCTAHPKVAAVSTCAACDAAACRDCLVSTPVGYKCAGCAGRRVPAATGRTRSSWLLTAAVLLLASGLGAVVTHGDEEEAEPARRDLRTVHVEFDGAGGFELSGSLDLPQGSAAGDEADRTGVVVLSGGGASTDRVGYAGDGRADPFYADLGRELASTGAVALRFDKRGAGLSRPLPASRPLRFEDRVADAAAAVAYLRARPEVDPDRIVVVGHGEGGVTALRLAASGIELDAIVLVSTWGRTHAQVLVDEFFTLGDDSHMEMGEELSTAIDTLVRTGEPPSGMGPTTQAILTSSHPQYLSTLLTLDPTVDAARVRVPVLIVRGERDTSITRADVDLLVGALTHAPVVNVLSVEDTDHTLRTTLGGHNPMSANGSRNLAALREIVTWVAAHAEPRSSGTADPVSTPAT